MGKRIVVLSMPLSRWSTCAYPKTSSRSTSRRINNIPVEQLARPDFPSNFRPIKGRMKWRVWLVSDTSSLLDDLPTNQKVGSSNLSGRATFAQ